MPMRRQPRRIARELALLSQSQLSRNPDKLAQQQLNDLVVAAIRALTGEANDSLETAAAELQRGNERLLNSETNATTLQGARTMAGEAIELTQTAINRVGTSLELPEFVCVADQQAVRDYAVTLLQTIGEHRAAIDRDLSAVMRDWQLHRLPQIERDLLRLAAAEMQFLQLPAQVAIDEAIELAKRYADEEGARFLNGVLRRVSDRAQAPSSG
ncbi:MAG: transcription antitermination factor NusB [Cyanobacteria bacterium QS_8_64_29]|nr:MAG: transcription antitermination factor NusB [Cyanobacteria bacterium QS_8_64_29]